MKSPPKRFFYELLSIRALIACALHSIYILTVCKSFGMLMLYLLSILIRRCILLFPLIKYRISLRGRYLYEFISIRPHTAWEFNSTCTLSAGKSFGILIARIYIVNFHPRNIDTFF